MHNTATGIEYYCQHIDSAAQVSLSTLAWSLLEQACERRGLTNVRELIIYGENGKPYIKDDPFYFNLSHSGNLALCCLSDTEIGCDIQQIKPAKDSVINRVFHEAEKEYIINAESPDEYNRRFTRVWTLRESFIKQTGEGMSRDFKSYHFEFREGRPFLVSPAAAQVAFKEWQIDPGYLTACCYAI